MTTHKNYEHFFSLLGKLETFLDLPEQSKTIEKYTSLHRLIQNFFDLIAKETTSIEICVLSMCLDQKFKKNKISDDIGQSINTIRQHNATLFLEAHKRTARFYKDYSAKLCSEE